MDAPLGASAPVVSASGDAFVALAGDYDACWHWRAKGSCSYGDNCARASTHVSLARPPRGLTFMLYKTPREQPPLCLFQRTMACNGLTQTTDRAATDLFWANTLITSSGNSNVKQKTSFTRAFKTGCRVNHFPQSVVITHKDKLYRNLRSYEPLKSNSFLPCSFVLPAEAELCSKEVAAVTEREGANNSIWIAKPEGLGEGRGIQVLRNPSLETLYALSPYVIQRYISRPLLLPLNRKKFDLRIYLLVVGWEPTPRVLLYRDGLVRFAAGEYVCSADTLTNLSVHLCNNAVNRRADVTINSKNWTVTELREYMNKEVGFEKSFDYIWQQIRFIAVSIVNCASPHIASSLEALRKNQGFKGDCFELFGLDILVDQDRRAWLCEVNHMPDITCASKKFIKIYKSDFVVKSRLLADMLQVLFPDGKSLEMSPMASKQLGNFEDLPLNMQNPVK